MVKIYFDGADAGEMLKVKDSVDGYTTNPSLMRKAGISDYERYARYLLQIIEKPISFEVIADEFSEMERQATVISSWGENVYVKIPITNTRGESSINLIYRLCRDGIKVNVTAVFTAAQAVEAGRVLTGAPAIISIFAGRIADTGRDPAALCRSLKHQRGANVELLWASTRELINVKQAEDCGCDIITVPNELLKKMNLIGKDLLDYSLETVEQFYDDARASGLKL